MSASTASGSVRRFTVTHAAADDGGPLGAVLDPGNAASAIWAKITCRNTTCRSAARIPLLERRGLVPQFQRAKPGGEPMSRPIARDNAWRARIRSPVEHISAA